MGRSDLHKRANECHSPEQATNSPALLQFSMSKVGVAVLQQPTLPSRVQVPLNQTDLSNLTKQIAAQQANLPDGVCTGNLIADIDTDKIPQAIKDEIMKCAEENLLLDTSCRCAIYELSYWNWCRESLASEALGVGGKLGDLANEVLISTIIEPREKFLHKKIGEHGVGCKATAYSSSS